MVPEELRESLRQQPFEPFRLVLTDGVGYEILGFVDDDHEIHA